MIVFYCIEDALSRTVAEKLIRQCCPIDAVTQELGKVYGGYGHIKSNFQKYCDLAKSKPVLVITDLDKATCPPALRANWLRSTKISEPLPDKMLFCIAQTEIESWLLADTDGIAKFLGVSSAKLASNIETTIIDSKEYLVRMAMGSSIRQIRSDLGPRQDSSAATGINYNDRMSKFVRDDWNPLVAASNSVSLRRTITKLSALRP